MNFLLLVVLLQTGTPKPQHVLQCEDARRLVEALAAAGVSADAGGSIALPKLECGLASGPPGSEHFACTAPAVRGASARRLWKALAASGIEPAAAMMQAVFEFSEVRCEPSSLGIECRLTNEMRTGSGDVRGERVVKRRTSCAR